MQDSVLEALAKNLSSSLKEIHLRSCLNFSQTGFATMVNHCKNIQVLGLEFCIQIDDSSLAAVANSLSSSLQELYLQVLIYIIDSECFIRDVQEFKIQD